MTTTRQIGLIAAAAAVPAALGLATHLEHVATERACATTIEAPQAAPVAVVLPMPTPIVSQVLVEPGAGAIDFAFVVDIDGPYVVLANDDVTAALQLEQAAMDAPHFRGAASTATLDQPVWRGVDHERLPMTLRAAVGRHVRVFSAAGRVCTAKVGKPSLVSQSEGSVDYMGEGDVTLVNEEDGATPTIEPMSLWDDGRIVLVAPLVGTGCDGASWARDFELSEPVVYVSQVARETEGDENEIVASPVSRRVIQRSPAFAPLARSFNEHVAQFDDDAFTTRRLGDRLVGQRWVEPLRGAWIDVFVTDGEEFGGCGGFDPAWAAIRADADGTPSEPVWVDATTDMIHAVIDVEGDGRLEVIAESWLGPTKLMALDDEGPRDLATLSEIPFFRCPC